MSRSYDPHEKEASVCVVLAIVLGLVFGYWLGKHAADRWWQADEAKKIQTVWGIAGQSIWDNAAQCSTGCSSILGSYDPIPCGKDSVFMYPCPAKKVQAQSGKYSRLPYPVCMEDTGIGYGLVPIPCPKEQPKQ